MVGNEWKVCDEESRYCGAGGNAVEKLDPPAVDEKERAGATEGGEFHDCGPGGLESIGDRAIALRCDSCCGEP